MLRAFYLQFAHELMDFAEERIKEAEHFQEQAEYYIKMADETPTENWKACLKKIRKDFKITAKMMGKNMGIKETTVSQVFRTARNVSLAKFTRWLEAMGMEIVVFDPSGKPHRIERLHYSKEGASSPFMKKKPHELEDEPEVWFK